MKTPLVKKTGCTYMHPIAQPQHCEAKAVRAPGETDTLTPTTDFKAPSGD